VPRTVTVSVEVDEAVPEMVTDDGENEQVAPAGDVIAQVRLTAPVKPPPGVTVTVLVPVVAGKVIVIGVPETPRLGTAAELTVREMAAVAVTLPVAASAPFTVTV
jgi:hypothetical protein